MYGIIVSTSIFVSALIAEKISKQLNKNPNLVWQGLIWIILFGVMGARIYHVIDYFAFYAQNPSKILAIWQGGLGILGALIGGFIGLIIFLKKNKQPVLEWLDIAGLVTPLGQSIGRWGNFFNKELYGRPTKLPWGINIDGNQYHPLFLYESVFNLLLFLGLFLAWKNKKFKNSGEIFFYYILGYAIIRFWLEKLKLQAWTILGINIAQVICITTVLIACICLYRLKMSGKKQYLL